MQNCRANLNESGKTQEKEKENGNVQKNTKLTVMDILKLKREVNSERYEEVQS